MKSAARFIGERRWATAALVVFALAVLSFVALARWRVNDGDPRLERAIQREADLGWTGLLFGIVAIWFDRKKLFATTAAVLNFLLLFWLLMIGLFRFP